MHEGLGLCVGRAGCAREGVQWKGWLYGEL